MNFVVIAIRKVICMSTHVYMYGIELTISPYFDGAICACSNHFIGLSGMVLGPGYYLGMNLWRWIGLENRSLGTVTQNSFLDYESTYIDKIPCPDTAIFISADYACLGEPKTRTTSIRRVQVAPERVEHLARSDIEESHLRIEGGYKEGGPIGGWNDGSHWFC